MSIRLDVYVPDLVVDCCPDKVYAIIFNDEGDALKWAAGPAQWQLATYVLADHADFAIALAESSDRSKFYTLLLEAADYTLADTPDGTHYWMEYWLREAVDTNYDRTEDTLLESRRFYLVNNELSYTQLNLFQRQALQGATAQCTIAYDSEEQKVRFMAWLERGGAAVTDAVTATVYWTKRDGTVILNTSYSTHVTGQPGVFCWEHTGIDLEPDEVSVIKVTIEDADGNLPFTYTSMVTWD